MGKLSFPGWLGPIVGAAVGLGLGLREGLDGSVALLILWATAGAAAGCVVWFADDWVRRRDREHRHGPRRPFAIASPAIRAGLWFWTLLLFVVGSFVGYLGVEKILTARRMAQWPTVEATILESQVKVHSHTNLGIATESFTPVIRYRYRVAGVDREGRAIDQSPLNVAYDERDKAEAAVTRYPVGSTHPVYYDPDDPAHAVLDVELPFGEIALFIIVPLGSLLLAVLTLLSLWARQGELEKSANSMV